MVRQHLDQANKDLEEPGVEAGVSQGQEPAGVAVGLLVKSRGMEWATWERGALSVCASVSIPVKWRS